MAFRAPFRYAAGSASAFASESDSAIAFESDSAVAFAHFDYFATVGFSDFANFIGSCNSASGVAVGFANFDSSALESGFDSAIGFVGFASVDGSRAPPRLRPDGSAHGFRGVRRRYKPSFRRRRRGAYGGDAGDVGTGRVAGRGACGGVCRDD